MFFLHANMPMDENFAAGIPGLTGAMESKSVFFEDNYIRAQAPMRTQCAGFKLSLAIKDPQYKDLRPNNVRIIAYEYNPKKDPQLTAKGGCLLAQFPLEGVKFDRPAWSGNVYYRIYAFYYDPVKNTTGKPISADAILRLTPIPSQLCLSLSLPSAPLNLIRSVTKEEWAGIVVGGAAVLGAGAALASRAAKKKGYGSLWRYVTKDKPIENLTEQELDLRISKMHAKAEARARDGVPVSEEEMQQLEALRAQSAQLQDRKKELGSIEKKRLMIASPVKPTSTMSEVEVRQNLRIADEIIPYLDTFPLQARRDVEAGIGRLRQKKKEFDIENTVVPEVGGLTADEEKTAQATALAGAKGPRKWISWPEKKKLERARKAIFYDKQSLPPPVHLMRSEYGSGYGRDN